MIHWWDQHNDSRRRAGVAPIRTWAEMTAIMRQRFVPSYFHRDLHHRLQSMVQGSKSVSEYNNEMEIALVRAQVHEGEEATMARFLQGLNREIANALELTYYGNLEGMLHMAIKIERQRKGRSSFSTPPTKTTPWQKTSWSRESAGLKTSKEVPKALPYQHGTRGNTTPQVPSRNSNNSTPTSSSRTPTRDIECFKCRGRGHMQS